MSNADDVLAELTSIGALGRAKPKTPPAPRVEEVDVEAADPEAVLLDQRGEEMVVLLTDAIEHLDTMMEGMSALRGDLDAIRRIWTTDPLAEAAPDGPQEALVRPEAVKPSPAPERAPEPAPEPAEDTFTAEQRQAAIEAARRKIRGEDLTPDERAKAFAEEEASIPAVGSDRAMPETDTGEISIGTVGTIKPSFPVEE